MALSFAKKKPAPQADETPHTKTEVTKTEPPKAKVTLAWMKTGAAAKAALANEEAKAELAKQEAGKLWRYWMAPEGERQITFLDGEVDDENMLTCPMFHEHQVKVNGNWENFICTSEQEGHCPICDKGESKPYLVGVLTVVDHTPHKIKTGPNAGKVIQNTRKLFVAKKATIKILTKIAAKRGGLTGATFDVTRGDDKTSSVGSQFDFVAKRPLEEIASKYDMKMEDLAPANYEEEITYRKSEELIELGVGKKPGGVGYEKGVSKKNLKDEL